MQPRISLIAIMTDNVPAMTAFYRDVLGFHVERDLGNYVELQNEGSHFSLCDRTVMFDATGHESYRAPRGNGQSFELAFPCNSPADVEAAYDRIITAGGTAIKAPFTTPWGMHTGYFADPDGNIHEVFCFPVEEAR